MRKHAKRKERSFFGGFLKANAAVFLFVVAALLAGLLFGAASVEKMPGEDAQAISDFLSSSAAAMAEAQPAFSQVFLRAFFTNFLFAAAVWICGLSVFGFPLIGLTLCLKGYAYGFTTAYFVHQFGGAGYQFLLKAVFPQNVIYIPVLCLLGVFACSHSIASFRDRRDYEKKRKEFPKYALYLLLTAVLAALCALLEAAVSGWIVFPV